MDETGDGVDREEVDKRSVYVGQVDYGATPEAMDLKTSLILIYIFISLSKSLLIFLSLFIFIVF